MHSVHTSPRTSRASTGFFRHGAGAWLEKMALVHMKSVVFTVPLGRVGRLAH